VQPPAKAEPAVERCLRCSAQMEWRHGTWQCPKCRFKLGCCEGEGCASSGWPASDRRAGRGCARPCSSCSAR